jgi:hypothetical protein
MSFGTKRILAAFLEKDCCKLLVYRVGGLKSVVAREFAGQISFPAEVLRDGFIADPVKFASQIKMAFAQKELLNQVAEVVCFPCPDKVFVKTLPVEDSEEIFIKNLPYFKEELVIKSVQNKKRVTYTAFEKKLIQDFQRPFLEQNKKVANILSVAGVLTAKYPQTGKYLLLLPLDKEVVVVFADNGEVLDLAMIKNEVLGARLEEFRASHDLTSAPTFSLGKFTPPPNLSVVNLNPADIYDLAVGAAVSSGSKMVLPEFLAKFDKKYFLLAGAVLVGVVLALTVLSNLSHLSSLRKNSKLEITSPVATPAAQTLPPAPEPKKEDYPIRILNGTLVSGEAGKLAEKLKTAGFTITETKNATSAGFVTTKVRVVSSVPEKIADSLETLLSEDYQTVVTEPLASPAAKFVVEIIVGKKK